MASDQLHAPRPDSAGFAPRGDEAGSTSPPKRRSITRTRLIWVDLLITVTTVLLVVGMVAVYANRLMFSPENWSKTSTQLLQNENVRSATANYVVDQLYANVDVADVLRSELPPSLQRLSGPAAGVLRNAAVQGADLALTRPVIQNLWRKANYAADQTFIAAVNGGTGAVRTNNGAVTLNLSATADTIASRLGLSSNLGSKLPPNIANLTVFKAKQLRAVEDVANAIKGLALWLTIFVPILYALAVLLAAGHRRRTLMTVGLSAVLAGVLVLFGRSLLESQVPGVLSDDALTQVTIRDVVSISTQLLSQVAGAVIFVGAILALCAWFAGPGRLFVVTRRAMAPFLREHPGGAYAITLAVMGLLFLWDPIPATGKPAGIVVFLALALFGTAVLRRQTEREFPDARPGDASRALRAWWATRRGRDVEGANGAATGGASTADQLRQLTELRADGAISDDEYQRARAHVLGY
jgi:Short C-terminal domain